MDYQDYTDFYEERPELSSSPDSRYSKSNAFAPRRPRSMATYNFPPPPPPPGPPPSNYNQQTPQYGYGQPPQHQQLPRGGGPPRGGRGGNQGGRGDFHNAPPYSHNNGYNGPQQGPPHQAPHQGPSQGPPQGQGPPVGYNPQHPYIIGPQAPGPQSSGPGQNQGPQSGYSGSQWQDQHHPQQHGPSHHGPPQQHGPPQNGPPHQQPSMQQPAHVAPLSAQNYHPNYAPQAYQPQYGPQQPPQQFQGPPQHQPPYNGGPPQGGPPQWAGPPQNNQQPFNSRGRGRGGFNNGRGGPQAPLMGPPIRMGFGENGRDPAAQAGNGFPQPYPSHQSPAAAPFSQPVYQAYPPNDFSQRPPLDQNPYNASQRGRGNQNFRGRGRGDFQFRRGDNRHQNGSQRPPSETYHKPAGADAGGKKKKKRRTNTLGLTPNGVDHEESEEEIDDVDEEARLVTLLGPDTPLLPSDLDSWLAERKSKFPTKARREAAAEELRKRREQAQNGKIKKENQEKPIKNEGESKLERQQRKAEKLRAELEKAERRIQDSMSGSKRKRETGDEGDDDRGQASEEDSDDSSDSDSSSKPETLSSRNANARNIPQPPKAQLQRHCKYFSTGGTCGKKGKCRFVHDQEVRDQALRDKEANGGKMTLAQRLILNDTAKDDLTILKSIKYLKEKGLLSDSTTASAIANGENGFTKMEYAEST